MLKIKKSISIILSLLLALGLSAYKPVFADDSKTITIIHTNDVHGRAEGDQKELIGYAKLKTFYDAQKAKNPDTLLVDAGDTLHGTTFANISEGKNMLNLMNEIGFAVGIPGNHDFNYGYERLIALEKDAKFDYLCANVVRKDGTKDFKANVIKDIDGVKIGFFGIATPETLYKSSPKNTANVDFLDYIQTSKKQVEELKKQGAQIIVAVTHLGIDESSSERSDILAKEVDGIDLIIDGHSHTRLPEGLKIKNTLIVQTGEYLKNIGVVNLEIKDGKIQSAKANLVSFEQAKDIKPDEKIAKEIQAAIAANKPMLDKVIGYNETELVGVREKVRASETNLGDLVTDAMKKSISSDVAITNGGGIRASIKKGDIKMGDILTSFPFTNFVVGLEVKGDVIASALEHGVDKAPEPAGKFPQVSGLTFIYDISQPSGKRVSDIKVNGENLDTKKSYKLATNDFMAIGGDDYTMFKGAKKIAENALLSDVLVDYIKENGGKINYKENGNRIVPKSEVTKVDTISEVKADDMKAIPTTHKIIAEGKSILIEGYIINGDKYFQVRDIAAAFSNTAQSFDVQYDKKSKSVVLKKNTKYSGNNAKLSKISQKAPKIVSSNQKIMVNGKEDQKLKVYLINSANYVSLAQLSTLMNLNIK
ncbi:5'-nucleotidase, C-terminal domain protein [Peptoanaerobacter stomatis]|jgi:5'-nucleotidase|uniref:5'-nucleotidase, C-terminal domain protein n=1 Tax=Peptoanaerobacter stomatis TaxID=796937 RepID=J5WVS9_9FIRM|nr:bifunctional UDP-sugar hydrolase/5'-nucleotidase [Peptoanaerobacter stomatis]EJU24752.1 5'-nucleotidase, C-terminal domain protein [Peptoanaerobacter stomatis]